jgi:hypothetical protein
MMFWKTQSTMLQVFIKFSIPALVWPSKTQFVTESEESDALLAGPRHSTDKPKNPPVKRELVTWALRTPRSSATIDVEGTPEGVSVVKVESEMRTVSKIEEPPDSGLIFTMV